ncbi:MULTISPECIES: PilN domain-containing protein [Pseudoalteromonas]|uniref:Pilus assembly protein PilN n=1 Tax=Pseudoalteromonas rubra TaxID=43658 RepID=A0A5S3UZ53_9GAMM|nr:MULTISPECIES: PilN domain-containing protein [Pseudoalteromonas]MCG7562188.1 PilN domain-containing protein [Pseudoalteromonas sp. McH1-42]MEC4091219.1 PilN domain-containing protein [Pseudoalteromonas rubra]QPB81666.1 pilus assembly protein PilN [Pseudoalteromonas rubra]
MPHINLLPWREQQRQASQQKFLTILGIIVAASLALMYGIGAFYDTLKEGQEIKNLYLSSEIKKLDKRIGEIRGLNQQKENLQRRIRLIEELQSNRNLGTQIIDEVTRVVPAGVYLTSLERQKNMIKVIGRSESNNRLSQMLRAVESSYLLRDPLLQGIVAGEREERLLSNFTMNFYVKTFAQMEKERAELAQTTQAEN